jgi:hypothetical protein
MLFIAEQLKSLKNVSTTERVGIFCHKYYVWFLYIPDPKPAAKERGDKKFVVLLFFVAKNHHKIVNYFIFELVKKKIWANLQRIIELFTQKIKISKIRYRFWIRDPGSKRLRIRNTDYYYLQQGC